MKFPPSPAKRIIVVGITIVGAATFVCSWGLGIYWSATRPQPNPDLGRVVAHSDHGRKYYLTAAEDRFQSEYVFLGSAALILVAGILNQRWRASVITKEPE